MRCAGRAQEAGAVVVVLVLVLVLEIEHEHDDEDDDELASVISDVSKRAMPSSPMMP